MEETLSVSEYCVGGVLMRSVQYRVGKPLTNERTHPYCVDISVAAVGLDVPLNRQIINFHKSRHLQLRNGRIILRGGESYYRWCFADLMTALAFVEQFGGALYEQQIFNEIIGQKLQEYYQACATKEFSPRLLAALNNLDEETNR